MLSERATAIAAGVGLAVWVIGPIVVVLLPVKQHDPQRGQAVGCLMLVAVAGAVLGGLLGLGVWLKAGWLVRGIGWVALFPFGLAAMNGVMYPIVMWRKRRLLRRLEAER